VLLLVFPCVSSPCLCCCCCCCLLSLFGGGTRLAGSKPAHQIGATDSGQPRTTIERGKGKPAAARGRGSALLSCRAVFVRFPLFFLALRAFLSASPCRFCALFCGFFGRWAAARPSVRAASGADKKDTQKGGEEGKGARWASGEHRSLGAMGAMTSPASCGCLARGDWGKKG
jgi:hypothetical protein